MILSLALKSLNNRKFSAALVIVSITLSVALLLGVERLRVQSLKGLTRSVSGVDLIVGAQTGSVNLLLYSIFHVGTATNNVTSEGYEFLESHSAVQWAVPIALGDSHKGYPLVGTTEGFFTNIKIGRNQSLSLEEGSWFSNEREVVLGSEVASTLDYDIGDKIIIAHGGGDVTFIEHDSHPFVVSGILDKSGTPIDRAIHASLSGVGEMHAELNAEQDPFTENQGAFTKRIRESQSTLEQDEEHGDEYGDGQDGEHDDEHAHSAHGAHQLDYDGGLSAVLLGLKSRPAALFVQRDFNEYAAEPLTAILPGLALQELWSLVGYVESGLFSISVFVTVIGLIGMFIALMSTLDQRRREMAIFRAVGAGPVHIMAMIVLEAVILTLVSIIAGVALIYVLLSIAQPLLLQATGLYLEIEMLSSRESVFLAGVLFAGLLVSIIPGYRIYRYSVSDGITVRQ